VPKQHDWAANAELAGLRAVIDPADAGGGKNRLIDAINRRAIAAALGPGPNPRWRTAVDFGCGIGRLSNDLLRYADVVHGIDPEPSMLLRARVAHAAEPRVAFHGAVDDLPELSQPALVVCVYVLQVLPRAEVVDVLERLGAAAGAGATLVVLDRVVRPSSAGKLEIERRTVEWYADALRAAGWEAPTFRVVRRSDSRVQRLNARIVRHAGTRLPEAVVRALAAVEASRASRPAACAYVDVVGTAVRSAARAAAPRVAEGVAR
jgi:SAM-dependent methyltransferase